MDVRTTRPTARQLRTGEQAVWGVRPAGQSPRRLPRLKDCTPHRLKAMLTFLSAELASGMIVNGLRLMTGKNGPWVAMPLQKQLDRDGRPRLDADGKPIFNQIVEFRDRAMADRFNAMVLELVRRERPDVLDGEAGL